MSRAHPSRTVPSAGGTATAPADASYDAAPAPSDDALDYETRRQQQIARNQQLLTQLTGVASSTSLTPQQAAAMAEARAAAAQHTKEARARARAARIERMAMMPRRDMPSRRARADISYAEPALSERSNAAAAASSQRPSTASANGHSSDDDASAPPRPNASLSDFVVPDNYPIGRQSSGTSSKDVSTLPLAVLAQHLGQTIPLLYHTPKASAMSFLVAGWPSEDNRAARRAPPTFNKMSGIQKLQNHVAIFINVDEDGSAAPCAPTSSTLSSKGSFDPALVGYGNQWHDGGRRITWFAQPTQRVDTPVIAQIVGAVRARQARMDGSAQREGDQYAASVLGASGAAAASSSSAAAASASAAAAPAAPAVGSKQRVKAEPSVKLETGVKMEDEPTAASLNGAAAAAARSDAPSAAFDPFSVLLFLRHVGGPYIYAGTLAYHAHDTTRTPMRFIFTLADFDTLIQQEDFRQLLPANVLAQRGAAEAAAAAEANGAGGKSRKAS